MENRESETVEFKKSTSELKQGIISLSSMLNKSGSGILYFGVLNDSTIIGQQIGKDTTHDISVEIKNHIKPEVIPIVELLNFSDKQIIKVSVVGDKKPYSAYGRYYIRSDDEDLLMSNEVLEQFFKDDSIDYSKWENTITEWTIEDIDEERLIKYFNEANECGRLNYVYKDSVDALTKLGLFKNNHLNNAGYYLFSKNKPLKLKLAVFNTDDRLSFSDIKLFEGNIFDCIEEGIRYISERMRWNAKIVGTKRIESPEIPLEAIREIVVNSFAHMKVSPAILNEIYLTPTKIKISNPGNIAKNIDPIEFAAGKQSPILRNPLIDMTLYKNNTIDSFATGFERTFKLCKEAGIKWEYENTKTSFSFTFIRSNDTTNDTTNDTIKNRQNDIINLIKKAPSITRKEIAQKLNISEPTVARDLKMLQEIGVIKRNGSNKTGHWKILENGK